MSFIVDETIETGIPNRTVINTKVSRKKQYVVELHVVEKSVNFASNRSGLVYKVIYHLVLALLYYCLFISHL